MIGNWGTFAKEHATMRKLYLMHGGLASIAAAALFSPNTIDAGAAPLGGASAKEAELQADLEAGKATVDHSRPVRGVVHKAGEEGTILIDQLTGQILTPIDDQPDWASGLAVALVEERRSYYARTLGPAYGDANAYPEAYEFADLGWVGVDGRGESMQIDADGDHRMDVIAEVLGVDRDAGETAIAGALVDYEMDMDARHVASDVELADEALAAHIGGFGPAAEADAKEATG